MTVTFPGFQTNKPAFHPLMRQCHVGTFIEETGNTVSSRRVTFIVFLAPCSNRWCERGKYNMSVTRMSRPNSLPSPKLLLDQANFESCTFAQSKNAPLPLA